MLCVLVNIRFQVLFHSPPGVLFTFPSQYFSTIGHWVVFRLGGWAPHLPYGVHVSVGTLDTDSRVCVSPTWLSHSPAGFPTPFGYAPAYTFLSEPRRYCYLRFSLFRFRSPLLAESRLMFQFPEFPAYTYGFSIRSVILHHGGFPIRKSADQYLFTAPRSLSQLVTSFFGSQCQGIHLMLFFA